MIHLPISFSLVTVAKALLVQSDSTLTDNASIASNVSATVRRPCSGLNSRNKAKHLAVSFERRAMDDMLDEDEIFRIVCDIGDLACDETVTPRE
jgi:hypothetical protein